MFPNGIGELKVAKPAKRVGEAFDPKKFKLFWVA